MSSQADKSLCDKSCIKRSTVLIKTIIAAEEKVKSRIEDVNAEIAVQTAIVEENSRIQNSLMAKVSEMKLFNKKLFATVDMKFETDKSKREQKIIELTKMTIVDDMKDIEVLKERAKGRGYRIQCAEARLRQLNILKKKLEKELHADTACEQTLMDHRDYLLAKQKEKE